MGNLTLGLVMGGSGVESLASSVCDPMGTPYCFALLYPHIPTLSFETTNQLSWKRERSREI
jgi:hypothetical protein